jgi:hypothetical protein
MRYRAFAAVTTLGMIALAGCSSQPKTSPKSFEKPLDAYFADHSECLYRPALNFPLELPMGKGSNTERQQLDALTGADLLKKETEGGLKLDRYTLTAAGERAGRQFCYGHRTVTGIDGFTPPAQQGGFVETTVSYRYTMQDVPLWVKTPAMEKAFPKMAQDISGNAIGQVTMGATGAGWEVVEK